MNIESASLTSLDADIILLQKIICQVDKYCYQIETHSKIGESIESRVQRVAQEIDHRENHSKDLCKMIPFPHPLLRYAVEDCTRENELQNISADINLIPIVELHEGT